MATEAERVLGNPRQLNEYLETLPTNLELRFPSITSLKGDFAVIMIIYNTETKSVLLGAYDTRLSGLPKDEVEIEDNGYDDDITETRFTLLRYGITKETGLVMRGIKWLGPALSVKNTNPAIDAEFHERNYVLINSFKGSVKDPDEMLNPKIKDFVWVKDFLLKMIFDQPRQLMGTPIRPHPQKEAYERFAFEMKQSKLTGFKKLFKRRSFKTKRTKIR